MTDDFQTTDSLTGILNRIAFSMLKNHETPILPRNGLYKLIFLQLQAVTYV